MSTPSITDLISQLAAVSRETHGSNVIFYYSKGTKGSGLDLQDVQHFKHATSLMAQGSNLALILNTPGGLIAAADEIIREMHKKFNRVTAIVPDYAQSAGTLIALACHQIVISSNAALSPTDPQHPINLSVPVREIALASNQAGCKCPVHALASRMHAQMKRSYPQALQLQRELLALPGRTPQQVEQLLEYFCQDRRKKHTDNLYYSQLKDLPLNLDLLDSSSQLDSPVKEATSILKDIANAADNKFRIFAPFLAS